MRDEFERPQLGSSPSDPVTDRFEAIFRYPDRGIRAQAHDAPSRVLPVTTGSSADMRQVDAEAAHQARRRRPVLDNHYGEGRLRVATFQVAGIF